MSLKRIVALSCAREMDKIATELGFHIGVTGELVESVMAGSFLEEMLKEGATRAVKEWRAAQGAGDTGTADAIARGYGQLGLKPRYLEDVSIGGAEAGVDRMMGDVRHSTGQMPEENAAAPRRALDQRLTQMRENKAQLGLEGRTPTQSVKSSPEGRAALLRGTQPQTPTGAAPNESGYIARKMYKPDSYISQAEFTPQHVQQKMEMTQAARSLSPEARAMVPDMYGSSTRGAGPMQRTMSYHEFVPGMRDLRGRNTGTEDRPIYSSMPQAGKDLTAINEKVIGPLSAKGMIMGDVTGQRGTNWGNVARDASGQAKVVDFLPQMAGRQSPAAQSFAKYAPGATLRHSEEGGGTLGDLRKEMYKPTMQSQPASPEQLQMALREHGLAPSKPASPAPFSAHPDPFKAPVSAVARTSPAPVSAVARTSPAPVGTAPAAPRAMSPRPMGTSPASPGALRPAATAPASPGAIKPPSAPAIRPGGLSRPMLPTRPSLGGLHR